MLHMTRIQVLLDAEEREAFRRRAAAEGKSLSSWLRDAGRRQLELGQAGVLVDAASVREFFASIPDDGLDHEPDWDDHRTAIEASLTHGLATT